MMIKFVNYCLFIAFLVHNGVAQPTFKIFAIEGTAKVQRSQKKTWDNIKIGEEIRDKDIVETYFQSKIILKYGTDNSIIIGSNSRILLNVDEKDSKKINVNLTVFSGGTLVKILANSHVNIYTANAVAQIDSGTISTVVESKTGHTGFQVLNGSATARNISQQQGSNLSAGLTTIVLPGKEPTAPLYITYRHVSVLKHFFGDEFIDHEIATSGIKPTEDVGATNRLSFSQNLNQRGGSGKDFMYKKQFSHDNIYGIILDDRLKRLHFYQPIFRPLKNFSNKGELRFLSSFGFTGYGVYPYFSVRPTYHFPKVSLSLSIPLAKNYSDKISLHLNSVTGIFDKINYLILGNIKDSVYVKLGAIKEFSCAEGLVVKDFDNKSIYSVTQPLGISFGYNKNNIDMAAFIADVTNWHIGGMHFGIHPGSTWLGFGYYYDANQFKNLLTPEISRFLDIDILKSIVQEEPDKSSFLYKSNINIYEFNIGYNHYLQEDISFNIFFQFAAKMEKEYQYNDTLDFIGNDTTRYITSNTKTSDFIFKGPEFRVLYKNYILGIGYISETGKLTGPYFNSYYMSNRLRILPQLGLPVPIKKHETQNNLLNPFRKTFGLEAFFATSPFKGIDITGTFRQDFAAYKKQDVMFFRTIINKKVSESSVVTYDTTIIKKDSTLYLDEKINFGFSLAISINDSLWKPIKFGKLYLNQINGGYFPNGGRYFSSWGFNTGLELISAPLFFNLAFETGYSFTYIDLFDENNVKNNVNNNIDKNDTLFEFYVGILWGFN